MRTVIPALFRKIGPGNLDRIWFISHSLAVTHGRCFEWGDLSKGMSGVRNDFRWAYKDNRIRQPKYLTTLTDKEIFVLAVWMWAGVDGGGTPPSWIRTKKNLNLWLAWKKVEDPGHTPDFTEKDRAKAWGDHVKLVGHELWGFDARGIYTPQELKLPTAKGFISMKV